MSRKLPSVQTDVVSISQPGIHLASTGEIIPSLPGATNVIGTTTSTLWKSEGHPIDRKTGVYRSGGPFHMTRVGHFINPGHVTRIFNNELTRWYSGPVWMPMYTSSPIGSNYSGEVADQDASPMESDGATAVARCAPTNPTANLGTSLAETFREGFPSLVGIQSWKHRTEILRAAGSEYLNYQFGWAPLQSEVSDVTNAARRHRDIMKNYRHNEGTDIHRRFDFSPEISRWEEEVSPLAPVSGILSTSFNGMPNPDGQQRSRRVVSVEKTRKRWFEGCFSYGGPAISDKYSRHIGFGREADAVFGLKLTPDVLWELTPWSWAVDWFTNAGDVIHNINAFAAAGLVMRYGFMMEERLETYTTEWGNNTFRGRNSKNESIPLREGNGSIGRITVTKSRVPANPFGFGVSWEGLSPTQLAITAAIGITRLL